LPKKTPATIPGDGVLMFSSFSLNKQCFFLLPCLLADSEIQSFCPASSPEIINARPIFFLPDMALDHLNPYYALSIHPKNRRLGKRTF
jgi:hypothetical protein